MIPALLVAGALATAPEHWPKVDPEFADPLLVKLEAVSRKNLDRYNAAIVEQTKIRAKTLAECGGNPPNQVQKARIEIAEEAIRDLSKSVRYHQQMLDALEKHKRGVPWDEAGFPKSDEK